MSSQVNVSEAYSVEKLGQDLPCDVIPSLSRDLDASHQRVEIPQLRFAPFGMTGNGSFSTEHPKLSPPEFPHKA